MVLIDFDRTSHDYPDFEFTSRLMKQETGVLLRYSPRFFRAHRNTLSYSRLIDSQRKSIPLGNTVIVEISPTVFEIRTPVRTFRLRVRVRLIVCLFVCDCALNSRVCTCSRRMTNGRRICGSKSFASFAAL